MPPAPLRLPRASRCRAVAAGSGVRRAERGEEAEASSCADPNPYASRFELSIGKMFLEDGILQDRISIETTVFVITEGDEPAFFTNFFNWDSSKQSSMVGNSLERKLALLKMDLRRQRGHHRGWMSSPPVTSAGSPSAAPATSTSARTAPRVQRGRRQDVRVHGGGGGIAKKMVSTWCGRTGGGVRRMEPVGG